MLVGFMIVPVRHFATYINGHCFLPAPMVMLTDNHGECADDDARLVAYKTVAVPTPCWIEVKP